MAFHDVGKPTEHIASNTPGGEDGIPAPDQLNRVGYTLLLGHRLNEAIVVMGTDLRPFPDKPDCHDSPGDALERNGERELALS